MLLATQHRLTHHPLNTPLVRGCSGYKITPWLWPNFCNAGVARGQQRVPRVLLLRGLGDARRCKIHEPLQMLWKTLHRLYIFPLILRYIRRKQMRRTTYTAEDTELCVLLSFNTDGARGCSDVAA